MAFHKLPDGDHLGAFERAQAAIEFHAADMQGRPRRAQVQDSASIQPSLTGRQQRVGCTEKTAAVAWRWRRSTPVVGLVCALRVLLVACERRTADATMLLSASGEAG